MNNKNTSKYYIMRYLLRNNLKFLTINYNIFVHKFVDFIIWLGRTDDCAKFNYDYLGAKDHNEPFFDKVYGNFTNIFK